MFPPQKIQRNNPLVDILLFFRFFARLSIWGLVLSGTNVGDDLCIPERCMRLG